MELMGGLARPLEPDLSTEECRVSAGGRISTWLRPATASPPAILPQSYAWEALASPWEGEGRPLLEFKNIPVTLPQAAFASGSLTHLIPAYRLPGMPGDGGPGEVFSIIGRCTS